MRLKTLIAGAVLSAAAASTFVMASAGPAAAAPTKPFPAMTEIDLKLFCQKNGGEYKGVEYGQGWYTCKLPNGHLVYCKAGWCWISIEPEPTTTPRIPIVTPTVIATATR